MCTDGRAAARSGIAAMCLLLACPLFAQNTSVEPDAGRRAELIVLVRQDCGSCHGLTLRGGLGPPLLPETLGDRPAGSLATTILLGRPGTPMPPWERFLSGAEADWIVRHLQKGFPSD